MVLTQDCAVGCNACGSYPPVVWFIRLGSEACIFNTGIDSSFPLLNRLLAAVGT